MHSLPTPNTRSVAAPLASTAPRFAPAGGLRALGLVGAALLALCVLAAPVRAEDEGESNDIREQIKAKMQRILKMMRENEDALLKLSTGKDARTQRVQIEVPPPQGSESASGSSGGESGSEGSSGSSSGTGTSETGAEPKGGESSVVRGIEELTRGVGIIPDEIKRLVEMIPT